MSRPAPIAIIEQKLLTTQIENAMAEVERLEANLALLKAANAAQIRSSEEAASRQLAAIDEQVAANEVRRDRLRELVAAYEHLARQGHDFPERGHCKAGTVRSDKPRPGQRQGRKVEVEAAATKRDDLAEIERQKQAEIDLKKAGVDRLRVEMVVGSSVRAPISGVIREIRLGRGDVAAAGAVIATVGQDQAEPIPTVMALLRGKTRKRAALGMEAHIVPDSIKKEEYGSMRGRVTAVSDEDVSVEHVDQIVHNDQLTKNLFGGEPALLA